MLDVEVRKNTEQKQHPPLNDPLYAVWQTLKRDAYKSSTCPFRATENSKSQLYEHKTKKPEKVEKNTICLACCNALQTSAWSSSLHLKSCIVRVQLTVVSQSSQMIESRFAKTEQVSWSKSQYLFIFFYIAQMAQIAHS